MLAQDLRNFKKLKVSTGARSIGGNLRVIARCAVRHVRVRTYVTSSEKLASNDDPRPSLARAAIATNLKFGKSLYATTPLPYKYLVWRYA
jgi:hypothetical protein